MKREYYFSHVWLHKFLAALAVSWESPHNPNPADFAWNALRAMQYYFNDGYSGMYK